MATTANAALSIDIGNHDIATAGTVLNLNIFATGAGESIDGVLFQLKIASELAGPTFTASSADFLTGTVFAGGTQGANVADAARSIDYSVGTPSLSNITLTGNQLLGKVAIDTTGAGNFRYGMTLESTGFVLDGGAVAATLINGSIAIGSNPSVIWSGGNSTNGNLLNFDNWLYQAAPLAGDSLHFAGATRPAVNFDQIAGTNYNSITFDAGASVFTLSGNDIGLLNGGMVTNDSTASQIINLGITLADSATNTLDAKAGDINYTGTIAVGANGILIFTDSVAGNNANHAVGNITGATGTVKNTAGNLTLAGTNTFGTLTVDAGSAVFEGGAAMSDTGTVNLNGTSTLILTNDGAFNSMIDTLTANTETVSRVNALVGTTINLNNNILIITGSSTLAGTITDVHNPANADVNGDYEIGLAGGLAFNTDAAVSISGNNTFALGGIIGNANIASPLLGTSLTAPTVTLGHDMALGTGGFTFNNGTLIASGNRTLANGFQIGGNVTIDSGGNLVITGDINLDGIAGDEDFGVDLTATARTFTVQNNTTFSGTVIGTKTFNKLGSGTLTLSGDNNTVADRFTGDFRVNEGILKITGDNSAAGNVTVNTGSFQVSGGNAVNDASTVALGLTGADFQVQGSETISKLSGVTGSTVQLLNGSILTTGATAGGLLADTTFAGVISGNGGLTINADAQMDPNPPGIVTLSGANNYTGATTVNSGALLVSGSIASAVTVNNTGSLGGNGTVNNNVMINSGGELTAVNAVTPATDSIETFAITGDVTVNSGGLLAVDIGSTGGTRSNDLFNITGTLTLASGAILDIANIGSDLIVAGNTFNFASVGIFNNQGATLTESVAKIGFNLVNNGGMLNLVAFEVLDATWTAGTGNFATTTNWDNHPDGVPTDVAGLGLIFTGADGAAAIAVNADAGPYTNIESITFADSATATNTFTLSGSSLGFSDSLTASITNNTVPLQTINNPLSTGADLLDINAASGDLQLNGAINTNTSGLNALGSNTTTISGIVFGSGVLNVNGSGMLTLTAANTYTGPTTINSGTLAISNTGSVTSNVTLTNGILSLGNDNAINVANTLTLNGGTLNASGDRMLTNAVNLGGDVIFSGNGTTLSGAITNTGINTLTTNNTQTTLSGNITGGGLIKSGASDLSLSGSNTLTSLDINAGKVFIKNANALTNVTAVDLTTSGAQMALSGVDLTVKSLTGVAGTTVSISGQTLTIAGSDMTTFAGV
ncbi:MAG: autotransporter-associated beta strand repeat-containing protein, partial [Phycisphaeraceae bacterium]|nr:autotransporter-associated beta strand repeat-containing protein [Phycisphaeraceae bacterium]